VKRKKMKKEERFDVPSCQILLEKEQSSEREYEANEKRTKRVS
jgi:hypothetical protein